MSRLVRGNNRFAYKVFCSVRRLGVLQRQYRPALFGARGLQQQPFSPFALVGRRYSNLTVDIFKFNLNIGKEVP